MIVDYLIFVVRNCSDDATLILVSSFVQCTWISLPFSYYKIESFYIPRKELGRKHTHTTHSK